MVYFKLKVFQFDLVSQLDDEYLSVLCSFEVDVRLEIALLACKDAFAFMQLVAHHSSPFLFKYDIINPYITILCLPPS
jgi:hypothetical protein